MGDDDAMSELEVEGLVWVAGGGKPSIVPVYLIFSRAGDQPSPLGYVEVVQCDSDAAGNPGERLQGERETRR